MIKQTPYPAFGYIILKNEFAPGDVVTDELFTNNTYFVINPLPYDGGNFGNTGYGYTWVYTSGLIRAVSLTTGAVQERGAGFCNLVTPEQIGMYAFEFIEPGVLFCLSPMANSTKQPRVPQTVHFSLAAGDTVTVPHDTKLFLAVGQLQINGQSHEGVKQIRFSATDQTVTATTNCYGLIFP